MMFVPRARTFSGIESKRSIASGNPIPTQICMIRPVGTESKWMITSAPDFVFEAERAVQRITVPRGGTAHLAS